MLKPLLAEEANRRMLAGKAYPPPILAEGMARFSLRLLPLKPMLAEEAKKRQGARTDLQKDNIPMNSWECSFDARKKKKLAEIWPDPTSSFDTKRYMADTASQQFGREYARHQRELASQVYIAVSDSKIKVEISYEPLTQLIKLNLSLFSRMNPQSRNSVPIKAASSVEAHAGGRGKEKTGCKSRY